MHFLVIFTPSNQGIIVPTDSLADLFPFSSENEPPYNISET